MYSEIKSVTTTALKRYRQNRRAFLFLDRLGDIHTVQWCHDKTYTAYRTNGVLRRFETLRDLRKHLETVS